MQPIAEQHLYLCLACQNSHLHQQVKQITLLRSFDIGFDQIF